MSAIFETPVHGAQFRIALTQKASQSNKTAIMWPLLKPPYTCTPINLLTLSFLNIIQGCSGRLGPKLPGSLGPLAPWALGLLDA